MPLVYHRKPVIKHPTPGLIFISTPIYRERLAKSITSALELASTKVMLI